MAGGDYFDCSIGATDGQISAFAEVFEALYGTIIDCNALFLE